jgi:hypothetical protein
MLKEYPALNKLRFNERQKFFWKSDAELLTKVEGIGGPGVRYIYRDAVTQKELSHDQLLEIQRKLFQGTQTPLNVMTEILPLPADNVAKILEGIPAERIQEYRNIIQTHDNARTLLISRARRDKPKSSGKIRFGKVPLDEKQYALNLAQSSKSLKGRGVAEIIRVAATHDDTRFFIRLGKAL